MNTLKTLAKLTIAGLVILIVGALFLVANPKKGQYISTADADIYSFSGLGEQHPFRDTMESLGVHARAYDFNGNVMYFGTSNIKGSRSARETAILVQEQLVANGVNSKNYLLEERRSLDMNQVKKLSQREKEARLEEAHQLSRAKLSGEVLPIRKEGHIYEMSGIVGAENPEELIQARKNQPRRTLAEFTKGYRYVEIRQRPGSNTAELLTIWSGNDFDARRMTNAPGAKQSEPDSEIPACFGCVRVRRFQALDKSEPYSINTWTTRSTAASTTEFYKRAMQNRGWKMSNRDEMMEKMNDKFPTYKHSFDRSLSFEKQGRVVEITIIPNRPGSQTQVTSVEKSRNTQPLLNDSKREDNGIAKRLLEIVER